MGGRPAAWTQAARASKHLVSGLFGQFANSWKSSWPAEFKTVENSPHEFSASCCRVTASDARAYREDHRLACAPIAVLAVVAFSFRGAGGVSAAFVGVDNLLRHFPDI